MQAGVEHWADVCEGVHAPADDLVALAAAFGTVDALVPDLGPGQACGERDGDEDAAPTESLHTPGLNLFHVIRHGTDHGLLLGVIGGGEMLDE